MKHELTDDEYTACMHAAAAKRHPEWPTNHDVANAAYALGFERGSKAPDNPFCYGIVLIDNTVDLCTEWPEAAHEHINDMLMSDDSEVVSQYRGSRVVPLFTRPQKEGYKLLRDSTSEERSFHEDAGHENGSYYNTCCECQRQFTGHKRRVICKVCAAENKT